MIKMIIFIFKRIFLIFHKLLAFYEHSNDIDSSRIYILYIYNELTFFMDIFRIFWEFEEIKIIKK